MSIRSELEAAERRRTARRTFGPHLTTYLFVNLLLFIVDAQQPGSWWFFWPLIGWGIAVADHAWRAFGGTDERADDTPHDLEPHGRA